MIQIALPKPVQATADHAILAEARNRLQRSSYTSLRRISCEYLHGMLTLRGEVPTYYLKQLAQSVLGTMDGVAEVNNQVRVASPRQPRG